MPHCPHRWAQVRKASTEPFTVLFLNTPSPPLPCPLPWRFWGHGEGKLGMRGVRQAPQLPLARYELGLSPGGPADSSRRIHCPRWLVGTDQHPGVGSSYTAGVLFRLNISALGLVSPSLSHYTVTAVLIF